ncbi:MAG TPA: 2-dehydropantoate 2-reductase [Thermodesulfobacteriota bacterium]|nr:2-dehydropantoate 2-reductase [Thermodesulfobacteriota bacterium]
MKIGIIGPGAMGCLLAGKLALAGNEVILLDHNPERAEFINQKGLKIKGDKGPYPVKIATTLNPQDLGDRELIINCVKAYDTKAVAKTLIPIGKGPYFLTLQNGVGSVNILGEILPKDKILAGITSHGATYLGYGRVRYAGQGDTFIGFGFPGIGRDQEETTRPETFASILTGAGFQTRTVDQVDNLLWSKLLVNVGINALTALTRLQNGALLQFPGTLEIMEEAVREGIRVGEKKGIKFIYEDMQAQVKKVCRLTAGNVSSMLQDVLKKKRTEIDFINGVIMETGRAYKIPVPVNSTLTRLIKTVEAGYDQTMQ